MSVIVTISFSGDPEKFEQMTKDNQEQIAEVSKRAREAGVIAHRFYGCEDQVMVVDEWPDEGTFSKFFDSQQDTIGPLLASIGAGEPQVRFWRTLDTPDKVGWGA